MLQKKFPRLYVMHSPEFLVLKQAAKDAAKPLRNIIGIPRDTKAFRARAKAALEVLPHAPYELICTARDAEMIKYAGNFFLYLKVLFGNLIYETVDALGGNYNVVSEAIAADPRIGPSHLQVVHDSGHKGAQAGRGAGGVCFIKDIEAFAGLYKRNAKDPLGLALIRSAIDKNISLLISSKKDLDLLRGVYGPNL
jgi:UDPglucose 6-dehydrogenase